MVAGEDEGFLCSVLHTSSSSPCSYTFLGERRSRSVALVRRGSSLPPHSFRRFLTVTLRLAVVTCQRNLACRPRWGVPTILFAHRSSTRSSPLRNLFGRIRTSMTPSLVWCVVFLIVDFVPFVDFSELGRGILCAAM